jgi:hypothetical protein
MRTLNLKQLVSEAEGVDLLSHSHTSCLNIGRNYDGVLITLYHLGDIGVYGTIILKWILKEWVLKRGLDSSGSGRSSERILWTQQGIFRFRTNGKYIDQLSDYQLLDKEFPRGVGFFLFSIFPLFFTFLFCICCSWCNIWGAHGGLLVLTSGIHRKSTASQPEDVALKVTYSLFLPFFISLSLPNLFTCYFLSSVFASFSLLSSFSIYILFSFPYLFQW